VSPSRETPRSPRTRIFASVPPTPSDSSSGWRQHGHQPRHEPSILSRISGNHRRQRRMNRESGRGRRVAAICGGALGALFFVQNCARNPRPRPPVPPAAPAAAKPASFTVTAYCLKGTTASGTRVARGIVAADPDVLPLGHRDQARRPEPPLQRDVYRDGYPDRESAAVDSICICPNCAEAVPVRSAFRSSNRGALKINPAYPRRTDSPKPIVRNRDGATLFARRACSSAITRIIDPFRRQLKRSKVHADALGRVEIEVRLQRLGWIHVNRRHEPARLVGADRKQRQIAWAEPLPNLAEERAERTVACEEKARVIDREHESAPQRAIAIERRPRGEVVRRRQRNRQGGTSVPPATNRVPPPCACQWT